MANGGGKKKEWRIGAIFAILPRHLDLLKSINLGR